MEADVADAGPLGLSGFDRGGRHDHVPPRRHEIRAPVRQFPRRRRDRRGERRRPDHRLVRRFLRMNLNPNAYALIGLTAMVAGLIGVLMFAVLRFASAARESSRHLRENKTESAFVTAALHEALTKLKAQEREMSARAEASERLSSEIVQSLSSGLLVVASDGHLRILNPAGRRLLSRGDEALTKPYRTVLPVALSQLVEECLHKGQPIVRRTVQISAADQSPAY